MALQSVLDRKESELLHSTSSPSEEYGDMHIRHEQEALDNHTTIDNSGNIDVQRMRRYYGLTAHADGSTPDEHQEDEKHKRQKEFRQNCEIICESTKAFNEEYQVNNNVTLKHTQYESWEDLVARDDRFTLTDFECGVNDEYFNEYVTSLPTPEMGTLDPKNDKLSFATSDFSDLKTLSDSAGGFTSASESPVTTSVDINGSFAAASTQLTPADAASATPELNKQPAVTASAVPTYNEMAP